MYAASFSLQFIFDFLLPQYNSNCKSTTWHKIFKGKINTDIAIIGTSRAEAHYSPTIIQEKTGLRTYNLGMVGTPYSILKIRWESYFNRNKRPKIVIVDVDESSFHNEKELFDKFQYLPFLYTKEYQCFAQKNDPDFYQEKYIPFYKYRGHESRILQYIQDFKEPSTCGNSVNGYIEHDIHWYDRDFLRFQEKLKEDEPQYDLKLYEQGLSVLKEIIKDCKKNNIKIYLVWSPLYHERYTHNKKNNVYIDNILKEISTSEDIEYLNFVDDSLSYHKKYFYNSSHMNKQGASIFSEKIGDLIK